MSERRLLILDLGLCPGARALTEALKTMTDVANHRSIAIDSQSAQPTDWDAVVAELLRCDSCITI